MPYMSTIQGKPVTLYTGTQDFGEHTPSAICVYLSYDVYHNKKTFADIWTTFLAEVNLEAVEHLIIGAWNQEDELSSELALDVILPSLSRIQHLKSLFFGDIEQEESEMSWIVNTDLGPLLAGLPNLTYFGARGGMGLRLKGCPRHDALRTLVLETGGLESVTVEDVLAMELPELHTLELWLGSSDYGFDGDIDTYLPLIIGRPYPDNSYPFPRLEHLALKNSEIADDLARAFLDAPVLSQLKSLDLSMGTLSDLGATSLLENEAIENLEKLDISNNFVQSSALIARLESRGPRLIADGQKDDGEYGRYVDVGE